MTTLSPLHVVVPSESALESDMVAPPTPYTPNSTTSLNHPDLPQPSLAQDSSATRLSSTDANHEHTPEMNHVEGKRESAVRQSGPGSPDGGGEGKAQDIVFTPIDTLPPSPPLTDNEGREEEKGVTPQEPSPALRSPAEDSQNWHSSADEREGSYHEDDLGYSTEVSPVESQGRPGLEAALRGVLENGLPPSPTRNFPDHPLRLDVHPPSPPPWETIEPPESNNGILLNGLSRHPKAA